MDFKKIICYSFKKMSIKMDISSVIDQYKGSDQEWYSNALVQNTLEIQYLEAQLVKFSKLSNIEDDIKYIKHLIDELFIERKRLSERYINSIQINQ